MKHEDRNPNLASTEPFQHFQSLAAWIRRSPHDGLGQVFNAGFAGGCHNQACAVAARDVSSALRHFCAAGTQMWNQQTFLSA